MSGGDDGTRTRGLWRDRQGENLGLKPCFLLAPILTARNAQGGLLS